MLNLKKKKTTNKHTQHRIAGEETVFCLLSDGKTYPTMSNPFRYYMLLSSMSSCKYIMGTAASSHTTSGTVSVSSSCGDNTHDV